MAATSPPADPEVGTWAWWRSATLAEVIRATGSRIPVRLLLAASFWSFIIVGTPGRPAYEIGSVAAVSLGAAAVLVVVRRVGWWSLVIPYARPVPFLGYWLWVFFAPPGRKGGWADWAAWVFVVSPFVFAVVR